MNMSPMRTSGQSPPLVSVPRCPPHVVVLGETRRYVLVVTSAAMASPKTGSLRELPTEFRERIHKWQQLSLMFYWLNLLLGGLSVLLCAAYASNAQLNGTLFDRRFSPYMGAIAALLTFLLTANKPSAKYAAYRAASHELEKAVIDFQHDPTATGMQLAEAEKRALDVLDRMRIS